MKIYLSPSMQVHNAYAWGNTNERVQCSRIAEAAERALERNGFEVKKAPEGQSMEKNVQESNSWKADLHVPIHTNAGGGEGTLVMIYGKGDLAAGQAVYDAVQAVTPGKVNYGVRVNSGLYELSYTRASAVYVECEFHDRADLAEWITGHTDELGEAICKGICTFYHTAYKPAGDDESGKVSWDTREKKMAAGEQYAALCTAGAAVETTDAGAAAIVKVQPGYQARNGKKGDLYTVRALGPGRAEIRAVKDGESAAFPVIVG